jgi:hypothetical protein
MVRVLRAVEKRKDPVLTWAFRPAGCGVRASTSFVVPEPDSCLYISDEGGIRGKDHSDTRQLWYQRT